MTELRKPIHRRTTGKYNVLRQNKWRKIVVTLLPGDVLQFREDGTRKKFLQPIDSVFRQAVRNKFNADRAAKRKPKKFMASRGFKAKGFSA